MLGAIVGDIAGSVYEWNNIKTKNFDIMNPKAHFTDDTVMTLAVAQGLMNADLDDEESIKRNIANSMVETGRYYPDCGYGTRFYNWLFGKVHLPYGSYGNGSAMRVSSVAYFAGSLNEAIGFGRLSASVTHDHPEGIKGAEAVAACVYLARNGMDIDYIGSFIKSNYYNLNFSLEEIRDSYAYDVSCQGSVPQAIMAFLESVSFEDAIKNAIFIGGDSDTIGAIAGGIAGAFYGVPHYLKNWALEKLDERLRHIFYVFEEKFKKYRF